MIKDLHVLISPGAGQQLLYFKSKKAKLLSNGLFPISLPIDWYQNLLLKINSKVAWAVPPAFIHGSENLFKPQLDKLSYVN